MNETTFCAEVNGETIYGIRHSSVPGVVRKNTAVVLLHGWAGYRTGPHDMLVKLARQLANTGYECFRFDFRGKGYSQGDTRHTNHHSMLEDLEAVLQHVTDTMHYPRIALIGICSGAKLALYYAGKGRFPITHVVEMSSSVLRQVEVSSSLAANQAKNMLKEYGCKLFQMRVWAKFMSGEIHFFALWRNITRPISRLFHRKKMIPKIGSKIPRNNTLSDHQPFSTFKGQMLLIHGEKDPETKPALAQIHEMLRRYRIQSDTYIVRHANHSFYSLAWEQEVIRTIENWLNSR